jgi:membrane-associated protease RseP (regulator of RpoE activity)
VADIGDKKTNIDNTESKQFSQTSQTKDEVAETVKRLRKTVERYFKVYDVKWDNRAAAFFCTAYNETLESKFNDLRAEIDKEGYVPLLRYEKGEHIIYVTSKPKLTFRSAKLNIVLLAATIFTTMLAGSEMYVGYESAPPDSIISPRYLFLGLLSFTVPLLFILGLHEFSHYHMAKKHGIKASLPFFIPAPGILGTFGAFINIREPIPNKKALFDIGVAGPIASFLASIPIILIGLFFMSRYPAPLSIPEEGGAVIIFGPSFGILPNVTFPLFYTFLSYLVPTVEGIAIHPTAFAGWVGLLVTAMNLLPAGQLDGGHMARAVLGDKSKYASYAAIAFMLFLGTFYYSSWLLFALLIIFLGISHPPPLDDVNPLDKRRKVIASFVCAILVLSFVPIPMDIVPVAPVNYSLRLELTENETTRDIGNIVNYTVVVNNTGNQKNTIKLNTSGYVLDTLNNTVDDINTTNVAVSLFLDENKNNTTLSKNNITSSNLTLNASENRSVTLSIYVPENITYYGKKIFVNVTGTSEKNIKKNHTISVTIAVKSVILSSTEQRQNISSLTLPWTQYNITVKNIGKNNDTFNISRSNITALANHSMNASWSATISDSIQNLSVSRNNTSVTIGANESKTVYLNVSVLIPINTSIPAKEGVSITLTAVSETYKCSFDEIKLSAVLRV